MIKQLIASLALMVLGFAVSCLAVTHTGPHALLYVGMVGFILGFALLMEVDDG